MTITHLITADELEAMGSDARFELIQGALHEMSPSSFDSSRVLSRIGVALYNFVDAQQLGEVTFAEAGYILEENPDTVVAPDVAFVRKDRLHLALGQRGFFPAAPDLIVEVISPTDEPADIRRKQALYDRIGIPMVWWIDPKRKSATVHIPGEPLQHLRESDSLEGASIVPGFSIRLANLLDL
jgi:Uma2 family endonuclease